MQTDKIKRWENLSLSISIEHQLHSASKLDAESFLTLIVVCWREIASFITYCLKTDQLFPLVTTFGNFQTNGVCGWISIQISPRYDSFSQGALPSFKIFLVIPPSYCILRMHLQRNRDILWSNTYLQLDKLQGKSLVYTQIHFMLRLLKQLFKCIFCMFIQKQYVL